MDCTPTFNDLLDSDEREDTENVRQDQMESAVQPQQANNSCELQNDNNSGKRKQEFDTETSLKTPTKVIASKRDSTSHWMLGTHSSKKQCSKDPKHRNSIPRLEDNRLYYPSAAPYAENQIPILEANPAFPYPGCNNNKTLRKAFRNARQQEYKFQNAYPHRNEPQKENSQLIYGQSFATNILQPSDDSDYAINYSKPFSHDRISAFKSIENDPKLQKCNALYKLHPSKTNPHSNKRVGNQKILYPSVSQQTDDLNYGMRNEITVDKEIQLLGQNKLSSTDLVSETEMQDDNRENFPIKRTEERDLKHESAEQESTEESAEMVSTDESAEMVSTDESAEMVSTDESAEMESTDESAEMESTNESAEQESGDQENAEKHGNQENAEKSDDQENAEKHGNHENAEKSDDQENAEKHGNQENAEKSDDQENAEKRADQKNVEKHGDQKNAKKSADQKNAKKSAEQKNAKKSAYQKNAKKSAEQKNAKKSAEQKNAKKSADQKNAKKSADQKNAKKSGGQENDKKSADQKNSEQENAEKSVEQENSKVFTGKGYDSLEDFIKALYNNTLYKRY